MCWRSTKQNIHTISVQQRLHDATKSGLQNNYDIDFGP